MFQTCQLTVVGVGQGLVFGIFMQLPSPNFNERSSKIYNVKIFEGLTNTFYFTTAIVREPLTSEPPFFYFPS